MKSNRFPRFLKAVAQYTSITLVTLVVADLMLIVFGLFPPSPRMVGDPDVGFLAATATGQMRVDSCLDLATGEMIRYERNEDGVRTSVPREAILADTGGVKIAVTGDSQTDLCAPNAQSHPGVLEQELRDAGLDASVFAFGAGRYSPLQSYMSFVKFLRRYDPDVFLLNFYTGNDFNDLLRVDDRPHLIEADGGYAIAPPVWYRWDSPATKPRSRVLFVLRTAMRKTGVPNLTLRLRFLYSMATAQGGSLSSVIAYVNDLRRSVEPSLGYRESLTAQMLNQQLFFHWFPASRDESIKRTRALLELVRRENPHTLLVLSAIPSYELAQRQPIDEVLLRVLDRLPLTYEKGVAEETMLYGNLRELAGSTGWVFVDNLTPLAAYDGPTRLFNEVDYHLTPTAAAIVGREQARVVLDTLRSLTDPSWQSHGRSR